MSGSSNTHLLRARIAERLAALLLDRGARALGRSIGRSGQAIGARGDDASAWPFLELADVGATDEQLGNALIAYIRRDSVATKVQGEAVALLGDLMRQVSTGADLTKCIAEAAANGEIDREERADIRARILKRQELDALVLAELDAADGVHR